MNKGENAQDDIKSIMNLLGSLNNKNISDLFLTSGRPPAIRINGIVTPLNLPPTKESEIEAFLRRILDNQAAARFFQTGDMDVGYSLNDGRRFRFNLSRQQGNISMAARPLPSGELLFGDLGLPDSVARLADLQRGLVLVTGATGSGKSTTLAAMLHRINTTRPAHIVTIEDPIEFVHQDIKARISQREVNLDTVSFQTALRHVVRQSPDVIMIGEMRDMETMQVALSAALTGHLVLTTLHTIDTTQTLQRILSYFPEHLRHQVAMDLSLSLQGVVSQRLIPRADGKGRIVAVELMINTPAVSKLILEQRIDELPDLIKGSGHVGMITFNQSLLGLLRKRRITYEAGLAYSSLPDEFALQSQGMSTGVTSFKDDSAHKVDQGLDLKVLLSYVLEKGGSDLHLTVGRSPIVRITGQLYTLPIEPLTAGDMRTLLFSILSIRQRSIYELERELDFALGLESGQRFRVNAYYQKGHMAAALRAISSKVPDAKELMLPDVLLKLAQQPHGLLLVVGPTGSGKTTTLACLVDRINQTSSCRIITIEDPIEYSHVSAKSTIDQRELHADTLSFAAALKYILRQDPDVILVGEMRDHETIAAALTAAETGHLVLSTMHTNDAVQTVDRIVDVFPSHQQNQVRTQLAGTLIAVISQRLIPRKDGVGRVPAFEIMVATPAIRNIIRDNRMHQALTTIETSNMEGMISMDKALKKLIDDNLVAYDDALYYARHAKNLGKSDKTPPPE